MTEQEIYDEFLADEEYDLENVSAYEYSYWSGWNNGLKRAAILLRNKIRPQSEWIPVSERLPNRNEYIKNNGLFNVSDGNRSYSEWFDIYDTQKFGEPTMAGFRVDYAVIAWQPLPEPYKVGGEEE